MTNVGTIIARTTQTALGVHVRTIHENLAALGMPDLDALADRWFEHAVCRGIRHHQRSEIARVLVGFGAKIGKVDVAILQTSDRDDFEPGHDRTGRIGSVCGGRYQTDVAIRLTARRVILANREQTGEFAL